MFYIIIMILAVLFILPVKYSKSKFVSKVCYIISFMISFLPAALRYGIGTDYFYTYVPYFKWINSGVREYSEVGFNFLNKFIGFFTTDYKWLFFITSFIILLFIYKAIWDNSEDVLQSVLLIYVGQSYFYSMNMVRQAIAISIVLYSYKFLKDKKYIKLLICIVCASLFHSSALVLIPIFTISMLNISILKKIIIFIILFVLQPVFYKALILLLGYTKYGWYYAEGLFKESISILLVLQNIIILLLDFYYQKIYSKKITKEYKILSNINFIGVCLMILSYNIPLVFRVIRYCTIFQILLIPKLLNLSDNDVNKKIFGSCLFLFLAVCMIYQIIIWGGEGVYPYESIFGR